MPEEGRGEQRPYIKFTVRLADRLCRCLAGSGNMLARAQTAS